MLAAAIEQILTMDGGDYSDAHAAKLETLNTRLEGLAEGVWATPAIRLTDLQASGACETLAPMSSILGCFFDEDESPSKRG